MTCKDCKYHYHKVLSSTPTHGGGDLGDGFTVNECQYNPKIEYRGQNDIACGVFEWKDIKEPK